MKRSRVDPSSSSTPSSNSKLPSPPQKTQKRSSPKDPTNPKPTSAGARKANANGGADAIVKKEQVEHPVESKGREEEKIGSGFADGGEGFGLWCGSVEEEVLLGWFPFVEEHFPWSGLSGEEAEEEEGEYCDIWQLQHIHEIPSTTK